jgi:uroporphyrinogen-III synthase
LSAPDPFTSAELIDTLSGLELTGRRVIVLHYGERSETLSETLLARGAQLEELYLYRWAPVEKTDQLEELATRVVRGDVAALAITCQAQFRHFYRSAARIGLGDELIQALNDNVVVGAVGPICEAALRAHGVRALVVPDHPKMGPLIVALMRMLERRTQSFGSGSSSPSVLTH